MKLFLIFALTTLCAAQELDWKSLQQLAGKASDTIDVHLDGSLLRLAANFLSSEKADEAQIKKLVAGLTGVYVKSYEFTKAGEFSAADINPIRAQLKAPGWSRVVTVKSEKDGQNTEVYLRSSGKDQIGGLAIITSEAKQITIVQVLGVVSLSDLGALSAIPGVPDMRLGPRAREENQ